jgi:hypothetical protein
MANYLTDFIDILNGYPDNLAFVSGEYEFRGLHFRRHRELPWKNAKQMKVYYDRLVEENTSLSFQKFKCIEKERHLEKIHIYLSWEHLMKVLSFSFLGLTFITILDANRLFTLIILGLAVLDFGLSFLFKKLSGRYIDSLKLCDVLFGMIDSWPADEKT